MMKEKYKYLGVFLTIIFISGTLSVFEYYYEIIITVLSVLLTIWIFLIKKQKIDRFFLLIVLLWYLINSYSFAVYGSKIDLITTTGYLVRIYIAYLVLKIFGKSYFDYLEKVVFVLTLISLPIFLLQQIFPSFFVSLAPLFKIFTMSEQQGANGWYSLIYMFSGWAIDRNCGFMWEPAAFSMVIVWATIFNLFKRNFELDLRVLIYVAALITTFSTSGYLALIVIIILVIYNKLKGVALGFSLVIVLLAGTFLYQPIMKLDFMGNKIQHYISLDKELRSQNVNNWSKTKAGRLTIIFIVSENILMNPLGYGTTFSSNMTTSTGEMVKGANAVMNTIYRWGIIGAIFLVLMLYRYIKGLSSKQYKNRAYMLGMIALLVVFSSNSVSRNILFITILFYPILFKKKSKLLSSVNKGTTHHQRDERLRQISGL